MKQQQIILGSITATVSAIGLGYLGAQYLNQTTMYTVAGTMLGLGASVQLRQSKSKSKLQSSVKLLLPAASSIPLSQADFSGYVEKQTRNFTPLPSTLVGLGENSKHMDLQQKGLERGFPDPVNSEVSQEPQVMQTIFQPLEQSLEDHIEIIELDPSTEVIPDVDPVIERFLKLGLDEF